MNTSSGGKCSIRCPLCVGSNARLKKSFDATAIALGWMEELGIDIGNEFKGVSRIDLHACADCALEFFTPDSVAGSPALYEKLEKVDGYYLPEKWEHDMALRDMGGAQNGLEVGCGFGAFVDRVVREKGIPFEGCEQNPSAVRIAQARGICVRLENLDDLAKRSPGAYDVICSFQVLEHVTEPGSFLKSACTLLRPGGKLIFGVPNSKSYIKHMFHIFDAPPHHMTRWSSETLRRLPKVLPVESVRLAYEPLPIYRTDWYVTVHESMLRRYRLGRLIHPWLRSRALRLVRNPRVRRFLRGDTIYGCYVRKA